MASDDGSSSTTTAGCGRLAFIRFLMRNKKSTLMFDHHHQDHHHHHTSSTATRLARSALNLARRSLALIFAATLTRHQKNPERFKTYWLMMINNEIAIRARRPKNLVISKILAIKLNTEVVRFEFYQEGQ
jgi:hypothetical protein